MTKEGIINYVMNTPDNTNPAVLRSLLDQMENGGFNGMFVVHVDIFGILDKTWQEIHDKLTEGYYVSIISKSIGNSFVQKQVVSTNVIEGDNENIPYYRLNAIYFSGNLVSNEEFFGTSPDSYPEALAN